MSSTTTGKKPRSWKDFINSVNANQHLQDESTDTSLQPGEEYPVAPHTYMVGAHKQTTATMNHITTLLESDSDYIPLPEREEFQALQMEARENWLFPYTSENPCGTQLYEHWKTQFNTAVIQIVSGQFQQDRRVSKGARTSITKAREILWTALFPEVQ